MHSILHCSECLCTCLTQNVPNFFFFFFFHVSFLSRITFKTLSTRTKTAFREWSHWLHLKADGSSTGGIVDVDKKEVQWTKKHCADLARLPSPHEVEASLGAGDGLLPQCVFYIPQHKLTRDLEMTLNLKLFFYVLESLRNLRWRAEWWPSSKWWRGCKHRVSCIRTFLVLLFSSVFL